MAIIEWSSSGDVGKRKIISGGRAGGPVHAPTRMQQATNPGGLNKL